MELLELNFCLQKFMEEEEFVGDQTSWFDPLNKSMDLFFWKCEEWMKEGLRRAEHAEEWDKHITPTDRSTTTKVTTRSKATSQSGSSASSASSISLKAEMERASLRAKAAALQKKLAIEQEEADWHAEKRQHLTPNKRGLKL